MADTYYDRLGVPEDATTADIKRAYRERLKETHPDVSDDVDAGDRTKRLIEAKDVLTDEDERARYDRLGHDQYVSMAGGPAETGPEPNGETTSSGTASDRGDRRRSSSSTGEGNSTTDRTGGWTESGWSDANRTTWGDATDEGVGASSTAGDEGRAVDDSWRDTEREKRRKQRHRAASDADTGGNTAWRSWDTDGSYSAGGGYAGESLADGESLFLLCTTFLFYPLMLAGALFPGFPLFVNGVLALCVLVVVAYLQSMPTVGVVVFGTWSALVPVIFASLGIGLLTPAGVAALCGTVLPLGLSLLTRAVIKP